MSCIGPADGAMYFTIGGRGAQSELFRVTYVGKESTAKVEYTSVRQCDGRHCGGRSRSYHAPAADPAKAVEFLVPLLGHPDRFIRYAARVGLEHQPVEVVAESPVVPAEQRGRGDRWSRGLCPAG